MGTGSDNIQWCVEAANPRIKYLEGNLKRKKETVKLHSRKGFPGGSAGKESACNAGDLGLIPGLGRSPEEGKGYLLQYSGLDSSMDSTVNGVTESDTTEQLALTHSLVVYGRGTCLAPVIPSVFSSQKTVSY